MKRRVINTFKALLALTVLPFALATVGIFMIITFGKMAVKKLIHRSVSAG